MRRLSRPSAISSNAIDREARSQAGMTVAEIGSGWGSLAIHMASATGARVVAINVSPEQIRVARERAAAAGVDELVEFRELDYRALDGRFDRIVSVGMMEHVGIGQFDAYFGKIKQLLTEDGYAVVHCIGRMRPPSTTGPFIRKHIFPGAYVPSLSEVFASTERQASGSRTWRCCGCTTTTPCATGGNVSPRTVPSRRHSTTSASAACGNTTSGRRARVPATARTWFSSCCCRARRRRAHRPRLHGSPPVALSAQGSASHIGPMPCASIFSSADSPHIWIAMSIISRRLVAEPQPE